MPPSLEEAIHLVSGSAAVGQLKGTRAGIKRIYATDDMLTSGPCDVDPDRHAELRRAWDAEVSVVPGTGFRKPFDVARLPSVIEGDAPVVLWGTRGFADLVWLWWALDGFGRIGAAGPRFFLARPDASDEPFLMVGHFSPDTVRLTLAAARPVTDDEWREGADLWFKYASPSPLAFDEARRAGSSTFPELTRSTDLHGAWFPRLRDGRLHLSELDEVLLGCFDDSWRSVDDIYPALPEPRDEHLGVFDAYFPIERLCAWARHGVLERETLTEMNPFARDRFRATDRARALLVHGLDGVGDAPPMYIGGCRVNDPASPWIRIEADGGWRLALLRS